MSNENSDIAVQQTSNFSPKSANKTVFIVRAEDPQFKKKIAHYLVVQKLNIESSAILEISGFQISETDAKKVKTLEDVDNITKDQDILKMYIPWSKIINIENITYKQSKAHKEIK